MLRLGLIFSILATVLLNAGPAMAERRIALVVGNSSYRNTPSLENPKNDAREMAAVLQRLGFEVIRGIDLTSAEMRLTVRKFAGALQSADVALFFYAGHGLQVRGQNYLVPIDAKMRSTLDLEFEATNLQVVVDLMEREAKTNFVFLDACRDNPLARTLARSLGATRSGTIGQGLARMNSGVGTLISYSTEPGNVALDGDGKHSPFTEALLQHIATPGLEVGQMLRRVRSTVLKKTRGKQVPWDHSSLVGDFYFGSPQKTAAIQPKPQGKPAAPAFDPRQIELSIWNSIKDSADPGDFRQFLTQFPNGAFAPWARSRLATLKKRTNPQGTPTRPPKAKPAPPKEKAVAAVPPTRTKPMPQTPIAAAPGKRGEKAKQIALQWQSRIDALKEQGPHGDCEVQIHDPRDRDPAAWAECEERTQRIAALERRMTREVAMAITGSAPERGQRSVQTDGETPDRERPRILAAIKSYYEAEGSLHDRPDTSRGGIIVDVESYEVVRRTATEVEVRLNFQMSPHDFQKFESRHDNRFWLERRGEHYRVLKMWSATLGWVSRRTQP